MPYSYTDSTWTNTLLSRAHTYMDNYTVLHTNIVIIMTCCCYNTYYSFTFICW